MQRRVMRLSSSKLDPSLASIIADILLSITSALYCVYFLYSSSIVPLYILYISSTFLLHFLYTALVIPL
jgi:hypothetical protein